MPEIYNDDDDDDNDDDDDDDNFDEFSSSQKILNTNSTRGADNKL